MIPLKLEKFYSELKLKINNFHNRQISSKSEERLTPIDKAFREFFNQLPNPLVIGTIRIGKRKIERTIVVYDFNKQDNKPLSMVDEIYPFTVFNNNIKEKLNLQLDLTDFTASTKAIFDSEVGIYLFFFQIDFIQNIDDIAFNIFITFAQNPPTNFFPEYETLLNFNELYQIEKPKILRWEELLNEDARGKDNLVEINGKFYQISLETLQEKASEIMLIPPVPENVRLTFSIAKKLYIYTYFEYNFGMVSYHYASLAFEAALKTYFVGKFKNKVILKNKNGEEKVFVDPSFNQIQNFIYKTKGWNPHNTKINGELFPYSLKKLVEWVINKKNLPPYYIDLFNTIIELRNFQSHPIHMPIFPTNAGYLHRTCYYINLIFYESNKEN